MPPASHGQNDLTEALPALLDLAHDRGRHRRDEIILCNCNLIPENVRRATTMSWWSPNGTSQGRSPRARAWIRAHALDVATIASPKTIKAFRDGYVHAAGRWPALDLASFAVAATSWLNWTYNTFCESIDPADNDQAAFADRETVDLLNRPVTRSSLRQLLAAVDG